MLKNITSRRPLCKKSLQQTVSFIDKVESKNFTWKRPVFLNKLKITEDQTCERLHFRGK